MQINRKTTSHLSEITRLINRQKKYLLNIVIGEKNILLLKNIIPFIFFFQIITFKSTAQTLDVSNSGILYISSGEIFSTEGSFTNSSTGSSTNEGFQYIKGDWVNDGSFLSETGKVTFWGASEQTISGTSSSAFYEATINNSAGINLSQTISVDGTLELSLGKITTSSNEVNVTNDNTNAINPYSSTSYIVGNLRRSVLGTGTYNFPIGTATNYELANIQLSSATGFTSILGKFVNSLPSAVPGGITINGTPISDMLDYGYWTLTPNSSILSGTYNIVLNLKGASNVNFAANRYGILKREDSNSPWQSIGIHNNNTQSLSNNMITAALSSLTSFSDFGIGFGPIGFPLPIELIYFNSELNNTQVNLSWATTTEINSDYFIVERSFDAIHFSELLKVNAAGNSTAEIKYNAIDEQPLLGISYYRLRQVDIDGSYKYSMIDQVNYQLNNLNFSVIPNPTTSNNLFLSISGAKNLKIFLNLIDATGKRYLSSNFTPDNDFYKFKINSPQKIVAGYYVLEISCNGKTYTRQIVLQ